VDGNLTGMVLEPSIAVGYCSDSGGIRRRDGSNASSLAGSMDGHRLEFDLDSNMCRESWRLFVKEFETSDPFCVGGKLDSSVCSVALDCKSSCENRLLEDDILSVLEDLVPIAQN